MQQGDLVLSSYAALPVVDAPAAGEFTPSPTASGGERQMLTLDAAIIRMFDLVGSIVLILILLPVLLVIATAIATEGAGPIFFGHRRIGKDGRTFRCLKFRTMVVDAEQKLRELLESDAALREEWRRDHKLRDDPRVGRVGRFLRKTSLDELPQLINVLRGEMSLVGPRPIVEAEIVRYGRYYPAYSAVVPGITGLWQISGRSDVSYRRRVACDILFIQRRSPALYLVILARTPIEVLSSKGSY